MNRFVLSPEPIDVAALRRGLDDARAGAVLCFEGTVRNHQDGRAVLRLSYQSYAELAASEGQRIVEEAATRFAVERVEAVHRVGDLAIGDVAVWVGVAAAHRDAAFAACRYVIDEVKSRVPIWKMEAYSDGESEWLHP